MPATGKFFYQQMRELAERLRLFFFIILQQGAVMGAVMGHPSKFFPDLARLRILTVPICKTPDDLQAEYDPAPLANRLTGRDAVLPLRFPLRAAGLPVSCMAYVDLNPVRIGIRESLDESEFTSIQARIRAAASADNVPTECPSPRLMPFRTELERNREPPALPIGLRDYIELVDWTGRIVRANKKGFIPRKAPSALSHLKLGKAQWRMLALEIQKEAIIMFSGLEKLMARERDRINKAT